MDGLLVVDKPEGLTSFDVVRKIRGRLKRLGGPKKLKVGHAGTLDPFATGVLLICVGIGTKLARFLSDANKTYRVTLRLGESTTTDDREGESLGAPVSVSHLDPDAVRMTLLSMQGEIMQRPPIYSALHVNGERAYKLARQGEIVELEPRPVVLHSVDVQRVALPDVDFDVCASKGTYVRAICRDLGQALDVGGHCLELRRLSSSGFDIEAAVSLKEILNDWDEETLNTKLLSPSRMLRQLPVVEVEHDVAQKFRFGQKPPLMSERAPGTLVSVMDSGVLVCVGSVEDDGRIQSVRVMPTGS